MALLATQGIHRLLQKGEGLVDCIGFLHSHTQTHTLCDTVPFSTAIGGLWLHMQMYMTGVNQHTKSLLS